MADTFTLTGEAREVALAEAQSVQAMIADGDKRARISARSRSTTTTARS